MLKARAQASTDGGAATVGRATCPAMTPMPYDGCGPGAGMVRKTNGLGTSVSGQGALRVDERG